MKHIKIEKIIYSIVRFVFLAGLCFTILFPLILKVFIALRSREDIMDTSIIMLPKHFTFATFEEAMQMLDYRKSFINTFLISAFSGLLHVASCILTAYALGKFQFKGKRLVYVLVAAIFIVPPSLISLPTYAVFKNFTFFGLLKPIFPNGITLLDNPITLFCLYGTANGFKSALYIFLFIQFFRNMPKELDEAAAVDGASFSRILFSIVLPNSIVMAVTVFLFTFVWQWTDLQYTSMFFQDMPILSSKLLQIGSTLSIKLIMSGGGANPLFISQIVSAGSIVFLLPLLVIYIISNRFFVQGLERSGIVE